MPPIIIKRFFCVGMLGVWWAQGSLFVWGEGPVPPEQAQSWTAPANQLPAVAVSAMAELFKEGLADPRGCEYREIEVKTGVDLTSKTRGWVLPDRGGGPFAVGWNGLIYRVSTIGPPASVQKDVDALAARDAEQWKSYKGPNRDVRGHWPVSEWVSVSQDNLLPIKAALLLRLGRADLAKAVWERWFAMSAGGKDDPYLLLAREWVESLYGRALCAHLRGDDALSLDSCRMLLRLRSTIEATAARRGFPQAAPGKPYLEGLEDLPRLAEDEERRVHEQPYLPVLTAGQPVRGPERVAALIRDLELVNAIQWSIPGETDVSNDPIVHALIAEGDPAVEP